MNSFAVTTGPKLMPEQGKKFRLITRSDMDGLVCAINRAGVLVADAQSDGFWFVGAATA
jgi:hypothetical protein